MLNVGVIGLGIGEAHVKAFREHQGCCVTALCDLSEERLKSVGSSSPESRLTRDANEILDDPGIGAVCIASYDNCHAEQVLRALEHGKHVFVEKPLCLSPKEAAEIRAALRKKPGLQLTSNVILRKSPRFIRLHQMVRRGAFGKLYYLEGDYNYGRLGKLTSGWRGEIDYYSVVYGGGIHLVDLILWLTGGRVTEVSAFANKICSADTQFRFNDLVAAILRFEDGAVAKVTCNFGCIFPHFHPLNLYGTKATFLNGRDKGLFYQSADPQIQPETVEDPYPGVQKGALIANFVDAALGMASLEVSTDDIFASISVCFAIEEAVTRTDHVSVTYY